MKQVIETRIIEIHNLEEQALRELDGLEVGTIERTLKWDFILELGFRKSELKYVLTLLNDSSAKTCLSEDNPVVVEKAKELKRKLGL